MPDTPEKDPSCSAPVVRPSSHADFWDERYQQRVDLFGEQPNTFVREETRDLPAGSSVLDIAAGEGRNALYLAKQGHRVTALDFSPVAAERLMQKVREASVDVEVVQEDILEWSPDRSYDAVIITFLQVLPEQRVKLYQRIQDLLAPGGRWIGLFFRPEQITEKYPSGGPPTVDRMITVEELRRHFPEVGIRRCEAVEMILDEGILAGPAAVIQFRYDRE